MVFPEAIGIMVLCFFVIGYLFTVGTSTSHAKDHADRDPFTAAMASGKIEVAYSQLKLKRSQYDVAQLELSEEISKLKSSLAMLQVSYGTPTVWHS
jgi:hypothetical protein